MEGLLHWFGKVVEMVLFSLTAWYVLEDSRGILPGLDVPREQENKSRREKRNEKGLHNISRVDSSTEPAFLRVNPKYDW